MDKMKDMISKMPKDTKEYKEMQVSPAGFSPLIFTVSLLQDKMMTCLRDTTECIRKMFMTKKGKKPAGSSPPPPAPPLLPLFCSLSPAGHFKIPKNASVTWWSKGTNTFCGCFSMSPDGVIRYGG